MPFKLPETLKKFNLYRLLGVENFAKPREIKQGYRSIALKYHPDRFAGKDSERFKLGAEAYRVLCKDDRRVAYNRMLRKKMGSRAVFENMEYWRVREKNRKGYYVRESMTEDDYSLFIDECRKNFVEFLKNPPAVKARSGFYNKNAMGKRDYDELVEKGRSDFHGYLSKIPRIRNK